MCIFICVYLCKIRQYVCNRVHMVPAFMWFDIERLTHSFRISPLALLQSYDWTITVTSQWRRWDLKSPATRLFAQPFVQAQIKENIKVLHRWPLWRQSTSDRWISLTKGPITGKMFPFDDVIMRESVKLPMNTCKYITRIFNHNKANHDKTFGYFMGHEMLVYNAYFLWPLSLTWFNFNPSMDK